MSHRPTPQRFPLKVVHVRREPSPRVLKACAGFGIAIRRCATSSPRFRASTVHALARELHRSRVVLITGPSGAGKSTLLKRIGEVLRGRVVHVDAGPRARTSSRAVLDALPGSLGERLAMLARAGLAEATLIPRAESELSTGQRCRFEIARAMAGVDRQKARWLLVDEFGSSLDRVTARGVATTVAQWARTRAEPFAVVVATAHEDCAGPLAPDLVVRVELDGQVRTSHRSQVIGTGSTRKGGQRNGATSKFKRSRRRGRRSSQRGA